MAQFYWSKPHRSKCGAFTTAPCQVPKPPSLLRPNRTPVVFAQPAWQQAHETKPPKRPSLLRPNPALAEYLLGIINPYTIMSDYLGHKFNDGSCIYCKASEKAVREFRVKCQALPTPAVSEPPLETPPPLAAPPALPKVQKQIQQSGSMDFHKLSGFILAFGIILACIGGLKFHSNLPLPPPSLPDTSNKPILSGWADNLDYENTANNIAIQNETRAILREQALKVIGAGAIIIFAGVAIRKSTRRPKSNDDA